MFVCDHSYTWDQGKGRFVQISDLGEARFFAEIGDLKWKFEPAIVKPEYKMIDYINLYKSITNIDPYASIYIGPRLTDWDPNLQSWRSNKQGFMQYNRSSRGKYDIPRRICVAMEWGDVIGTLAHEYMHWVLCTMPEPERSFLLAWGDFFRSLNESDYIFDEKKPYRSEYLRVQEEAEADAFQLWYKNRTYPYNIQSDDIRSQIASNESMDLSWVPHSLRLLDVLYRSIQIGEYTSRRNVLGTHSRFRKKLAGLIEKEMKQG